MITVLWDYEGVILVDAVTRGEAVNSQHLHQDADRTQEVFQMSLASQESNRNLASAWQCKASHKFQGLEVHHKIVLESVNSSTLQPQSGTVRFPPVWRLEACGPWYEVWDMMMIIMIMIMIMCFAQWELDYMSRTRNGTDVAHTCSSVQGHRSGRRLCGNIAYGVSSSLFILCDFYDLGINIY